MRVVALDVGERRIGLAISDASGTLARPLMTFERTGAPTDIAELGKIIRDLSLEDDGLDCIVLGLPRHLDGTPGEQTARVRAFASALQQHVTQPMEFQDERLSSVEAESRLALLERDWRRRKRRLDATAAAIILQDYLDRSRNSTKGSPPLGIERERE